ncbi:MAG: DUF4040 domain-containing protein [Clostridium sp.]|nr:DUF4040 domain-containing protein [Clostridium sp.]
MELVIELALLAFLITTAICVSFTKRLLSAIIMFMSYSTIMAVLWVMLVAPDLALTEAAVGAGITTILFLLVLKKIGSMGAEEHE